MNNKQVAHLWANRSRPSASGSHFYFEGDTIYSYGGHFPIARLVVRPKTGATCVLFTTAGYSSSTARHKSYARSACSHLTVYEVADVRKAVKNSRDFARLDKAKAVLAAKHEAQEIAANEKRAGRLLKKSASYPADLAAWRAGGKLPTVANQMPVALRVIGDEIETTKGARIPYAEGRRTFEFLKTVRARGWHRNGTTFAVGPFQLEAVNEQGVVAGCHRIAWPEIEAFAASQEWIA